LGCSAATLTVAFLLPASALAEEALDQEIVVSATLQRDRLDVPSPVTVIEGAALRLDARPQIGDSITRVPGVSAASFGPNASRPVLRGLTGERVRVLTDGIGAFDVSNASADHAVAIDPLTALRIEVVRGPAALRYGTSAIGGLVNVLDGRIPTEVPNAEVAADLAAGFGSAATERRAAAGVTARLGQTLALRVGGSLVDTGDLRTGAFVLSAPLRAIAAGNSDPEVRELATLRGRIPNSDSRTRTATAGLAFINGDDTLGMAVSHLDTVYAVPIRFDVTGAASAEAVFLDARQTRIDLRGSLGLGNGLFERLSLRGGYADYAHVEGGADPEDLGTRFANKGYELRLELVQRRQAGWDGAVGAQIVRRDFRAVGEEAFVPPNITQEFGVFGVQGLALGALRLEGGLRFDHRSIKSDILGFSREFNLVSASLGAVWRVAYDWRLVASFSSTARPPAAEELLANGAHVGTQAFEIGDPMLATERGRALDIGIRGKGRGWRLELGGYVTRFSNFIYQVETGEVADDLPVFRFQSAPARTWGLELDAGLDLGKIGPVTFTSALVADLVRVNITGDGPAPRIPPARVLGELTASGQYFSAGAQIEHVFAQRRVTGLESPTNGFTLVNLSLDWQLWRAQPGFSVTAQVTNLLDVEARRHASLLKDFAPMPGRDLRLAIRWTL
jgi:iron complex outermembrane receptor protein